MNKQLEIQYLINKYKKGLESCKLDNDQSNFTKTWDGAKRFLYLDIISDLEGLLK